MFEVTIVLCNIFHGGCLTARNVRHGYTCWVRDFLQRQTGGKKSVWPSADRDRQESVGCVWSGQSLVWTLCKKERLRWSKEMAGNGQRRHIPAGSWLNTSRVDTHSGHGWRSSLLRPARGQQPHSSMPRTQQLAHKHTTFQQATHPIQWFCHDATIQDFLQLPAVKMQSWHA